MVEEKYCDTSLIFLKSINKNIAKNLIIKNHYTHKWTLCTVAYGVYYKEYIESIKKYTYESISYLINKCSTFIALL